MSDSAVGDIFERTSRKLDAEGVATYAGQDKRALGLDERVSLLIWKLKHENNEFLERYQEHIKQLERELQYTKSIARGLARQHSYMVDHALNDAPNEWLFDADR